jgi:hypothetical protein
VATKFVDAKLVAELGRILPENYRFPTSSDQLKVAASNHHFRLFTAGFALPAFHFQLFTSSMAMAASSKIEILVHGH